MIDASNAAYKAWVERLVHTCLPLELERKIAYGQPLTREEAEKYANVVNLVSEHRRLGNHAETMARLEKLLKTIKARPTFAEEEWLIVLCSDHGGFRKSHGLSGGQCSTVPLLYCGKSVPAGILAGRPGNLDIAAAKSICELLGKLNKTEKSAILLITHDPVVAACADSVHFLKEGRIATSFASGHDPAEISRRYLEIYG